MLSQKVLENLGDKDEEDKVVPQHVTHQNYYSTCVFLIFNCQDALSLRNTEAMLVNGMKNKWKKKHNDPQAKRIEFIYLSPRDFDPSNSPDQNPKFAALANVDQFSHIYLIGHHYIDDNRFELVDDESATGKKRRFDGNDIARLLLSCIKNKSVLRDRNAEWVSPLTNQKLLITAAICNTAVGIKQNGTRDTLNSFSAQLADRLFNNNQEKYIDCVVSGVVGWVFPTPGKPKFINAMRVFLEVDIKNNVALNECCHKRYTGAFKLFNKMHPIHLPQPDSSKYKKYFTALPIRSEEEDGMPALKVVHFTFSEWKKSSDERNKNTYLILQAEDNPALQPDEPHFIKEGKMEEDHHVEMVNTRSRSQG